MIQRYDIVLLNTLIANVYNTNALEKEQLEGLEISSLCYTVVQQCKEKYFTQNILIQILKDNA